MTVLRVVVKGKVDLTNRDTILRLTKNLSTYIPLGEVCRMANPGSINIEIAELQSGDCNVGGDVVRFEDTDGRIN